MISQQYVAIPTSGLSIAIARELLIPDPIDVAKGVEIIKNAANSGTTSNNIESD